jgi:palmitoyltransferase
MRGAKRLSKTPDFNSEEIGKIMNISTEVYELLQEPSCIDHLNPISPPLSKAANSYFVFFINLLVFLFRFCILGLVIYEYITFPWKLASLSLGFLSLLFLLITSFKDPGFYLEKSNLAELYSKYKEEDVCPYCELLKEKSMKHCQRCNKCVRRFDHHCPWVHNCVGEK